MGWGAEQIALAIAGALFLVGVVASLHPRFALSLTSRIVLSAHASTPASVLGWLALRGDDAVSAAIAERQGFKDGTTTEH